jgi:hypothetical protein
MERVATQFVFKEFILTKLEVPLSRPELVEGFPFEFEMGRRMVEELGSFRKGYEDLKTWASTQKSVEEVGAKVMKVDKAVELFQTMAIVSLNMGNLILEANTLKNKLACKGEGEVNVIGGIG